MAYLEEIPKYKDYLIHLIVENPKISVYTDNQGLESDPSELICKNVFPYPYIPDTQTEVKTNICCDIYVPRVQDKIIKNVQIVINVFSHKDHSTYKGKTRVDLICTEIDKTLNGNQEFGIDTADLISVMPYYLAGNNYFGKQMIYNVQNFNQRRCRHNEHKF